MQVSFSQHPVHFCPLTLVLFLSPFISFRFRLFPLFLPPLLVLALFLRRSTTASTGKSNVTDVHRNNSRTVRREHEILDSNRFRRHLAAFLVLAFPSQVVRHTHGVLD